MTTITDKVTEPLKILEVFKSAECKYIFIFSSSYFLLLVFGEFCTLIRNDLMGISEGKIPVKKMSKKFGIDDP